MSGAQLALMERPYDTRRADIGRPWLDDAGQLVPGRKRAAL
jgi:hypothetical protein